MSTYSKSGGHTILTVAIVEGDGLHDVKRRSKSKDILSIMIKYTVKKMSIA